VPRGRWKTVCARGADRALAGGRSTSPLDASGHAVMRITAFTSLPALAVALSANAHAEAPVPVTICQLLADPPAYDHKLVRISGSVTFTFENFTLNDDRCQGRTGPIWLEYGGTNGSGAMYCCGVSAKRTRAKPLVVDGVATALVEDSAFQQFDSLLHQAPRPLIQATLICRYFAGRRQTSGDNEWGGFGHFGSFTLLVIQQVVSSEGR